MNQQTIDLDEVQVHYAEAPGPGPALVFVHGSTGSLTAFAPFMAELSQQAHVYAVDLRGHGLSGRAPGAYQVPDYGRDVLAFIQAVVGRPAFVAGHSMGGLIAVWLAAHAPDWVLGVFLEDPPLYMIEMERLRWTGFYAYFVGLRDYLPQHHADGGTVEDLIVYVGESPVNENQTMLEAVGPEMVRERAIQLQNLDPTTLDPAIAGIILGPHATDDLLSQIRCPVYLLAGQLECGGALDAQDVDRAVSRLPQCDHIVFEGVGHMIHQERADEYVELLGRFVENQAK